MKLNVVRSTEVEGVQWAREKVILFKGTLNRIWKHRKDRGD